jgi:predicted O-methyltransferase YrrM
MEAVVKAPVSSFKESDGETFELNGLRYILSTTDYTRVTTCDQVVLLKPSQWVGFYETLLLSERINRVLELGVFQGGMTLLLPSLSPDLHYLGVEWMPELPAVTDILARRPDIGDRVRIEFGKSQDDPGLPDLATKHFGGQPLDLIIDDASHMYGYTRRSFSQFFPLLRPGGLYIIEDWGWAHWRGFIPPPSWTGEPCLSNLLFEIVMATASQPGVFEKIEVHDSMFVVRRGPEPLPEGWTLDRAININDQVYCPILIPKSELPGAIQQPGQVANSATDAQIVGSAD